MKKRYILLIIIVVFGLLFWAITWDSTKDVPPLPDNTPPVSLEPEQKPAELADKIVVASPLPESTVSASPIIIKGRARGTWFFEASASVDIVNWDGLIIGKGYVTVDEGYSWMTTDFVPFTGSVTYDATKLTPYKYGWIIMRKDNPSGEPQFDASLEFKILFP